MNIKWLSIISGVILLLAIPTGWPYSFYILLRWVICISALIVAYGFYKSSLQGWALIFGTIAFIFNPLFPVYLNKNSWIGIDLISAMVFFLANYPTKKRQ